MKRARTRVLTVVIAISLVLMLMLPLLAQSITNPLDNVGAIAQTFEGALAGRRQAPWLPWLLLTLRLCPLAPYPGNSALRINSAVLWLLVLALCCAPGLDAQAQAKPTIAILRFGFFPTLHWMEGALLDNLALYGWLSADERETLRERQDLQGEKLNIFWGDADFDYSAVTVMVDQALDREADVLVTLSTPVTQAAVTRLCRWKSRQLFCLPA